jgi:hypothetical protein
MLPLQGAPIPQLGIRWSGPGLSHARWGDSACTTKGNSKPTLDT